MSSTTIGQRVSALETRADDTDARADALEAKGEALRGRTAAMETRQDAVEVKVKQLDAFAGPGQNEALSESIVDVRKKLDLVLKTQEKIGERLGAVEQGQAALVEGQARLEQRQSTLEEGQVEIKATLVQILDRLPAKPGSN